MITNDKQNLLNLSLDLKRISIGIQRKSFGMADEFSKQAERWLDVKTNLFHLQEMISEIKKILKTPNSLKKAEDCLMYSTLLQNRAMKM